MDLIIVDMLPYSLVEGEAFRRLNFADPVDVFRYQLKFVCLLLNGTSALFRLLVPRIVEIEHTNHVEKDLKKKSYLKNDVKRLKNIFVQR